MDLEFKKIDELDLLFLNNLRNQCAEKYLHDSRVFTDYETLIWFQKTKPNYHVIIYKKEKIGYFRISSHSAINRNLYLGADILPDYRGKGLAKKSYQLFIPILFERYNLQKINLEVLSTNLNALQLYKSLGFKEDGIKRQEVFKEGKWVDSIIMSLLKEEYENWD